MQPSLAKKILKNRQKTAESARFDITDQYPTDKKLSSSDVDELRGLQEEEDHEIERKRDFDEDEGWKKVISEHSPENVEKKLAQEKMKEQLESGGKGRRLGETDTKRKDVLDSSRGEKKVMASDSDLDNQLAKLKKAYEKNPTKENRLRYQKGMIRYKTLNRMRGR
jgi:hypothetical protein